MKLLITAAFSGDESFYSELRKIGYEIVFINDEKADLKKQGVLAEEIEGVICNGLFLYNDIKKFSSLKFVQLTSAGLDRVPVGYINEKGIKLFNAKGVYGIPMAEYAVCGVLQLYKNTEFFYKNQQKGVWQKNRNLLELYGKTVCIFGCGNVGQECAKRFKAFGCKVIGLDISPYESDLFDYIKRADEFEEVFSESDVIVLTAPLTEKTENFIDSEKIGAMKEGCVIVNVSRGKVIDEKSLIDGLKRKLGGAVLDVFNEEPLSQGSPLWKMENVIVTPHNSFVGDGNNERLKALILKNLIKEGI